LAELLSHILAAIDRYQTGEISKTAHRCPHSGWRETATQRHVTRHD
jgi:hypothetical protein